MAIAQTGSVVSLSAGNSLNTGTVSTTISVPADAEIIIVGVTGACGSVANYFSGGGMTFTKGGVDTAMTPVAGGDATPGSSCYQGAMFYLVNPDTGSNKTLKWDWAGSAAGDRVPSVSMTFWKGIDTASPVRDSDGTQSAGGPPFTTPTLTAVSGDTIVAWAFAFTSAEGTATTWSNLTEIADIARVDVGDAAWASGTPSGNTTVGLSTTSNWEDGGIVAIVLKPAAAAAAAGEPIFRSNYVYMD